MAELCRMTNPLTMWSSCGIYTNLPYGYGAGYQGALPDKQSRAIADRRGLEYEDYYYYDYYYDDDVYDKIDRLDPSQGDLGETSILDSILDIILNRGQKKARPEAPLLRPVRTRGRLRPRLPLLPELPDPGEVVEKADGVLDGIFSSVSTAVTRAVTSLGFFGILLPGILAGLLYMGVPVAQSMFAGASLVTTYLLSGQHTKSLLSPASLDSVARVVLVTTLQFLQSLSDGKESRISDSFPFCINGTVVEDAIAETGCIGDFLAASLAPEAGILAPALGPGGSVTSCREGSLPDILHKIARQIVTVVGDCE